MIYGKIQRDYRERVHEREALALVKSDNLTNTAR